SISTAGRSHPKRLLGFPRLAEPGTARDLDRRADIQPTARAGEGARLVQIDLEGDQKLAELELRGPLGRYGRTRRIEPDLEHVVAALQAFPFARVQAVARLDDQDAGRPAVSRLGPVRRQL